MFRQKSPLVLALVLVVICFFTIAGVVSCAPKPPPPPPPAPAAFQIANLAISPVEVEPGGEVTISAEVTNTGGTEGSYTAELKIDGVIEATKQITLAAGASQLLSFTVSGDTPGTYRVTWDELAGEFVVTEPPPEPTARTVTWTDADITRLLVKPIPGARAHFLPDNKVQLEYSMLKFTFDLDVTDGKLWLGGVPSWIPQFLSGAIGEYTSYRDGKLFLTALPPWFDPTKEIAPDVTQMPTFESIETKVGEAIITYRWP